MAPIFAGRAGRPGRLGAYVRLRCNRLLAATDVLLADPRHFFRSYPVGEIGRLMTTVPARAFPPHDGTVAPRMRELNLYRRYFDLVATGEKTVEVRVK